MNKEFLEIFKVLEESGYYVNFKDEKYNQSFFYNANGKLLSGTFYINLDFKNFRLMLVFSEVKNFYHIIKYSADNLNYSTNGKILSFEEFLENLKEEKTGRKLLKKILFNISQFKSHQVSNIDTIMTLSLYSKIAQIKKTKQNNYVSVNI